MVGRVFLGWHGIRTRYEDRVSISHGAGDKIINEVATDVLFYNYIFKLLDKFTKDKPYNNQYKIVRYDGEFGKEIIIALADEI